MLVVSHTELLGPGTGDVVAAGFQMEAYPGQNLQQIRILHGVGSNSWKFAKKHGQPWCYSFGKNLPEVALVAKLKPISQSLNIRRKCSGRKTRCLSLRCESCQHF